MNRDRSKIQEIRSIQGRLDAARSKTVSDGKSAFDAVSPQQAREQAQRLESIAEAEAALGQLDELLHRLGLTAGQASLGDLLRPQDDDEALDEEESQEPYVAPKAAGRTRKGNGARLPDGPAHQSGDYFDAVLSTLAAHRGAIQLKALWTEMEPKVSPWLNVSDHGWMPNHKKKRWQYIVCWALTKLKEQGKVENPKRGYWKSSGT